MQEMQETWVRCLGQEDPLEEGMATHSSILPWRIPWTEEPGRLQSTGSKSQTWLSDWAHLSKDYVKFFFSHCPCARGWLSAKKDKFKAIKAAELTQLNEGACNNPFQWRVQGGDLWAAEILTYHLIESRLLGLDLPGWHSSDHLAPRPKSSLFVSTKGNWGPHHTVFLDKESFSWGRGRHLYQVAPGKGLHQQFLHHDQHHHMYKAAVEQASRKIHPQGSPCPLPHYSGLVHGVKM